LGRLRRERMSAPFRSYEPDQAFLFPPSPRDWLPTNHLAYFVMDVVASLDLKEILAYYDTKAVRDDEGSVGDEVAKSGRGQPAYDPRMMTALLLYAYVTGRPSSRQIEQCCREDVAFRVISANQQPDHSTIAEFRKVHLRALAKLFLQVLRLCRQAGLVKLGHVALDGTKVKANASKHKAMSYGRMLKTEAELQEEVEKLLRRAEEADAQEIPKIEELSGELARRESRLRKIQEAKAALEAEAKAEAGRIRREHEEEQKRRRDSGEPPKPGRTPNPPESPEDKAQRNFTDPESRIMKNSDKAFIQGYNAQAVVDAGHQVIVACDVTNQAADAPHLEPMVDEVRGNLDAYPHEVSADAGYFSEDNVEALEARSIDAYVAAERLKHGETPAAPRGRIPKNLTLKERMLRKLRTRAGRALYALRKITVEPVFGQIRTRGLMRFWLRGVENVKREWALWCTGHNLLKLFRGRAAALNSS